MIMTDATWKILAAAIQSVEHPPSWLRQFGNLTFEQVSRLPKLGKERERTVAAPAVSEKVLARDYLDFLREQIRIDARGPEWKELLQKRLKALEPFVGKKVLTADVYRKPNSVTLQINPETGKLFHVEIF